MDGFTVIFLIVYNSFKDPRSIPTRPVCFKNAEISFYRLPHALYPDESLGDVIFDPSNSWDDIKWLKGFTSLPIVLKGILTGEHVKS